MILVIGARSSGKRAYLESLGYTSAQIADGVLDESPVLYNLQDITMADPEGAPALREGLLKKEVVVCDEVGSGVIPMEKKEEIYRETVGRLQVLLAAEASEVWRVWCGIPERIR